MAKKVMFTLSAEVVGEATSGLLLGEFNNWDYNAGIELEKQIDGSMKAVATLESGKKYEYRYLLNDGRWVNDQSAHQYVHISGLQVENCVILVSDEIDGLDETNGLDEASLNIETTAVETPVQTKVKVAAKKTAAPKEKIVSEKTQNQEKVVPEKVTTPKVKAAPKNKTPKS